MYFGTHIHTQYSNISAGLDSINKLEDVVDKAKELGMSGLAITNHDNLSEVMNINAMQKKLKKNGEDFTLAIGNEIYLVDAFSAEDKVKQRFYHFILIAKDKIGYNALVELSSRAWYRSAVKWNRRRIPTLKSDIEEVITDEVRGHLVATTACLGGELGTMILDDKAAEAKSFVDWCIEMFGFDDFYIELQPSDRAEQKKFNKTVAAHFNTKFIIATDAHYLSKEDYPIFEAFLRSQQEKREVQEFYEFARLMGEEEIFQLMGDAGMAKEFVRECLDNTLTVQRQIEFYDLSQKFHIPQVSVPEKRWLGASVAKYPVISELLLSQDIQTNYCIVSCLEALRDRNLWNDKYLSRLEEDCDVFKFQSEELNDNFFKYFNTMQHYINLAWSIECAVGPSRGSASGSIICYLMDIVQGDPIENGCYSWRFANKFRASVLDVDSDFQPSKRPELFAAIRAERGEFGMTQVATFRKLTLKAAIGNAGRGYRSSEFPNGLDADITTFLSSLIEVRRGFVASLTQTLNGDETTGYTVNNSFIKECKAYPGLMEIIQKIEGIIVGSSTHAAAVVLFDDEDKLSNHCSLMRAPNGDLCTALDLHTVEDSGVIKYDFLLLSTLDIQATTFKLLQKNGVIDKALTLKECFRKYIDPNKMDTTNPEIWQALYENSVLSIFQFDAASGRKGVLATKPENLQEITAVNGLIRLMTADGEEDQIERFVRIKNNPQSFEDEMIAVGLSAEQRAIMHEELDRFNGCAVTQESFMILSQRLANYTLKDADALRKTVAKKKMDEIGEQKKFFYEHCQGDQRTKDYLWSVIISPSLGYGFSFNHALPYSAIGIQCILLGKVLFPKLFWQTACLLQRSGALDDKSADYNKIAKAVSLLMKQEVHISPIDINKSDRDFTLDIENDKIYFGFSAIKGLKEKVVDKIIERRPFNSLLDFIVETGADITSIVALVKAGAFDNFSSREDNINILTKLKADTKLQLNGQNYSTLAQYGVWPQNTDELKLTFRIYSFSEYLKKRQYKLDDRCCEFLDEIGFAHDGEKIEPEWWKTYRTVMLAPVRDYMVAHQGELLEELNGKILNEWLEKYFPGGGKNIAQYEIETMGICFAPHPYKNVTAGIEDFETLSQEPEIASTFTGKGGRRVPLYRLTMISGICIAKDKLHSTVTILTNSGPVDVKYRKEQFAYFDSQVSKVENGKKVIIERSWFNRGCGVIVHGMRQDDLFMAKTYKNSPMKHSTYKITSLLEGGTKFEVQKDRKKGKAEEDNEDE